MIKLYGCPSPNVIKVNICLEEMGLPYDYSYVRVTNGEQFTSEFRALNPNAKVPVLTDDDGPDGRPITLFESGAILMYLADKTGKFTPPRGTAAYCDTICWLMWQMANVGPMHGQFVHFKYYSPDPVPYALSRYFTLISQLYGVADERLASTPYIAGDAFTIADMALYPWVCMTRGDKLPTERWPHLQRWMEKIDARPAVAHVNVTTEKRLTAALADLKSSPIDKLDRFFLRTPDPEAAKAVHEPRIGKSPATA